MSYAVFGTATFDVLLTAASHWASSGAAEQLSEADRQQLVAARDDPNGLGLALMLQNWEGAIYGADPDEEERAYLDEEALREDGLVKPTSYTFNALPEAEPPESILGLLQAFRSHSSWQGSGLGEVGPFVEAVDRCARAQLAAEGR